MRQRLANGRVESIHWKQSTILLPKDPRNIKKALIRETKSFFRYLSSLLNKIWRFAGSEVIKQKGTVTSCTGSGVGLDLIIEAKHVPLTTIIRLSLGSVT